MSSQAANIKHYFSLIIILPLKIIPAGSCFFVDEHQQMCLQVRIFAQLHLFSDARTVRPDAGFMDIQYMADLRDRFVFQDQAAQAQFIRREAKPVLPIDSSQQFLACQQPFGAYYQLAVNGVLHLVEQLLGLFSCRVGLLHNADQQVPLFLVHSH